MGRKDDRSFWDEHRAGRLDEGDGHELKLFTGHGGGARGSVRIPSPRLRGRARMLVLRRDDAYVSRLRALDVPGAAWVELAPFHLQHRRIARARTFGIPKSVLTGKSVMLWPKKGQVGRVRRAGAKRNWRSRVFAMRSDHPFLRTPEGKAMTLTLAAARSRAERANTAIVRSERAAGEFQIYIERARLDGRQLKEEVEHDELGPIMMGNLGDTVNARLKFWQSVAAKEVRADAVLQSRIVAELPFWVEPRDRRRIVAEFLEFFYERKLPVWASVHKPISGKGMDERNFHLHVVYHDPGRRRDESVPLRMPFAGPSAGRRAQANRAAFFAVGCRGRGALAEIVVLVRHAPSVHPGT